MEKEMCSPPFLAFCSDLLYQSRTLTISPGMDNDGGI